MKKSFIKSLIAVGVVGAMGVTSVAIAAEFNWYGSIRAGVANTESGLDLGATGKDGGGAFYSRIGIKGSTDLGNGQSAGVQWERGVSGDDAIDVRHHNVWIGGGWGKLTFGQQGNTYRSVANWDQSWFLGGNARSGLDGGSRFEGVKYSSNLGGPFSFDVTVAGNDSVDKTINRLVTTAHYDVGVATINLGYNKLDVGTESGKKVKSGGYEAEGTIKATAVAISANGSAGGFGWYLAYDKTDVDVAGTITAVATNATVLDVGKAEASGSSIGAFVSYAISENDKVYLEYETFKWKELDDKTTATIIGYSHSLGNGVSFIGEYATVDKLLKSDDVDTLNLVLKYDF